MQIENQQKEEEQKDLQISAEQMEQEFGNLEIIPSVPLTEQQISILKESAIKFKELYENFSKITFSEDQSKYYYLLSTQFLKRWKKYVSYEEAISGQQLTQFAGGPQINLKINIDLLDSENKNIFQDVKSKDLNQEYSYLGQFLKQDIYENKDFIFVNEEIWNFFVDQYDAVEFKRYVYGEGKDKKVEIQLKKLNIVILHQDEVKDIDFKYTKELQFTGSIQFSGQSTVEELTKYLEKQINGFSLSSQRSYQSSKIQLHDTDFVRIWNLDDANKENLFKYVLKSANSHKTTSYRIWLDANLINKEGSEKQLIDEQEILENNLLLVDVKALHKQFSFYNNQIPHEDKCEWCQVFTVLKYPCACKKVAYCSPSCKQKDLSYHEDKCDAVSDEGVGPFPSENSRNGIVGLQNIGNTCFMNSGLQCLQNCYELSNYFLQHRYLKDMNTDAPLGTKGELTTQYATLIKKLWNGENNVVNPRTFKKKLSQYHSIFQGYAQHDSQEFLTELISSMNEDLNLVKKKPILESQDTDGPVEYWNNYQARNNSIFTYLMSGQFKSQLKCPDCQKISITYDPYFMISLPIPASAKKKEIEAIYISNDQRQTQKTFKFSYQKSQNLKLKDFIEHIANQVNKNPQQMISFLSSEYYFDDMVYEGQDLNEVKKKTKYKNLLVRSLNEEEIDIPDEQKIETNLANKKFKGLNSYKTAITPIKKYYWNKNTTLKDVHLILFKRVKHFLVQTLENSKEQTDEEVYESIFQGTKPPYNLLIDNKCGYWSECHWCGNKSCSACDLAYSKDLTLGDLQEKVKDQNQNGIDFEIQWNFMDDKYKDIEDHFQAYGKEVEEEEKVNQELNKWNNSKDDNNKMESEQQCNDVEPVEEEKNNQQQLLDFSNNKPTNGVQEEEKELSLETCINYFETPEKLDEFNEVYCRKCEQHKQMEKKMSIQSVPQILIFQFKRFYRKNPQSSFLKKNGSNIKFPLEGLDMTDYIIDKQLPGNLIDNGNERVVYDCFGVSNHSGSMLGGHYTAYAKNISTNKWYSYNDSSVTEMHNLDDIVSGMAYIVFYRRRHSNISQEELQQIIYNKLYNGDIPEINIQEYIVQDNDNNNMANGVGNGVQNSNGVQQNNNNNEDDNQLEEEEQATANVQIGPLNSTGN